MLIELRFDVHFNHLARDIVRDDWRDSVWCVWLSHSHIVNNHRLTHEHNRYIIEPFSTRENTKYILQIN